MPTLVARRVAFPTILLAVAWIALTPAEPTRGASYTVDIADLAYSQATLTVNVGDTVTWTNRDPMVHTVTSTAGLFDSGDMDEGESWSVTFSAVGTYDYLCTPHPFMTARVVVVAGAAAPTPQASAAQIPNAATPAGTATPFLLAGIALVAAALALAVTHARRRASQPIATLSRR